MGKGDSRRVEDRKKIEKNWDRVFPPKKRNCGCWKYEKQVCDVCQRVTGNETDKK